MTYMWEWARQLDTGHERKRRNIDSDVDTEKEWKRERERERDKVMERVVELLERVT